MLLLNSALVIPACFNLINDLFVKLTRLVEPLGGVSYDGIFFPPLQKNSSSNVFIQKYV